MNSREVIKALEKDGWFEVNHVGSHKQFRDNAEKGTSDGTVSELAQASR